MHTKYYSKLQNPPKPQPIKWTQLDFPKSSTHWSCYLIWIDTLVSIKEKKNLKIHSKILLHHDQNHDRAFLLVEPINSWPFLAAQTVLLGTEENHMAIKINATVNLWNHLNNQSEWVTVLVWQKHPQNHDLPGCKNTCSRCLIQHWKAGKQTHSTIQTWQAKPAAISNKGRLVSGQTSTLAYQKGALRKEHSIRAINASIKYIG